MKLVVSGASKPFQGVTVASNVSLNALRAKCAGKTTLLTVDSGQSRLVGKQS